MGYISEREEEVRESYMLRAEAGEKEAFRAYIKRKAACALEEIGGRRSVDLASPRLENCRVILTAHYDTPRRVHSVFFLIHRLCERLFGSGPAVKLSLYFYCDLAILILFFGFYFSSLSIAVPIVAVILVLFDFISLGLMAGRKNGGNLNDNTSGVLALLELSERFHGDERVGFAFFDNEERGLQGSRLLRRTYLKTPGFKDATIVNLDCVGGKGDTLVISYNVRGAASPLLEDLKSSGDFEAAAFENYNLTDYRTFAENKAFNLNLSEKTRSRGYFIPDIHTEKDTELSADKVEQICGLVFGAVRKYIEDPENLARGSSL